MMKEKLHARIEGFTMRKIILQFLSKYNARTIKLSLGIREYTSLSLSRSLSLSLSL